MTVTSSRRTRHLLVLLAAVSAFAAWQLTARPLATRRRRSQHAALAARWLSARTIRARGLADTYAVVVSGERKEQWSELLQAAGVPSPLLLSENAEVPAAARLIVLDGPRSAALTAPERAVIEVVRGATRSAQWLRWGALTVPLAGFGVTPLTLAEGERAVAVDDVGAVVAALQSANGSARLRLGIDLADALWRLRFGSPENAGRDSDQNGGIQPADLAPRLSPELVARPFADELLAEILNVLDGALPCSLPRTRGLPEGIDSLAVLTSDQDYADDEVVSEMADALARRGAHTTFMLTDPSVGLPADLNVGPHGAPTLSLASADEALAAGHDLGVHPFPRNADDIATHLDHAARDARLTPLFARNHHIRWFGYADPARVEASRGVALNFDNMPVGSGAEPCVGFPGGSSEPVMFVDERGARIPIFQQVTSIDDYSLRVPDYSQLASAAARLASAARRTVDAARAAGVPVVVNSHPTLYRFAPQWLHAVLDSPGLRAISASQWLAFVLDRRSTRIPPTRCGARLDASLRPGVALSR